VKRILLPIAIACASSLAVLPAAIAKPDAKKDRVALAQLEAAYQPTGKLAAGPARTQQACADAAKLHTAEDAIPQDHAPAGAAVDDTTWASEVNGLGAVVKKLVEVCKTADHKISVDLQGKKFETADQIVDNLDHRMHAVIDQSKPRDLPAAMKKFRTTMDGMRAASKQVCAQQGKLAKLLDELAKSPGQADATAWQQGCAKLKASLDEIKQFGCSKPRGADEEIAGALSALHDRYYELVLLVPPHA
jgi:hypothetical protein